jgi:hypothetical protein
MIRFIQNHPEASGWFCIKASYLITYIVQQHNTFIVNYMIQAFNAVYSEVHITLIMAPAAMC